MLAGREPASDRDRPEHPAAERTAAAGPRRSRWTSAGRSSGCSAACPLDLVHVHEPFAPSTGSAALRHSQSLNVATFHEPVERVLSTQVARMLVEVFFGRIDERTREQRGDRRAPAALLPGPVRADQARRRRRRAGPRASAAGPGANRATAPRRSAARCGCCCAPSGSCPKISTGRASSGSTGPPTRSPASAAGCESGCASSGHATASRRSSWPGADDRLPRLGRGAGRSRRGAEGVRRRRRAGRLGSRDLPGAGRRGRAGAALPPRRRAHAERAAGAAVPRHGSLRETICGSPLARRPEARPWA